MGEPLSVAPAVCSCRPEQRCSRWRSRPPWDGTPRSTCERNSLGQCSQLNSWRAGGAVWPSQCSLNWAMVWNSSLHTLQQSSPWIACSRMWIRSSSLQRRPDPIAIPNNAVTKSHTVHRQRLLAGSALVPGNRGNSAPGEYCGLSTSSEPTCKKAIAPSSNIRHWTSLKSETPERQGRCTSLVEPRSGCAGKEANKADSPAGNMVGLPGRQSKTLPMGGNSRSCSVVTLCVGNGGHTCFSWYTLGTSLTTQGMSTCHSPVSSGIASILTFCKVCRHAYKSSSTVTVLTTGMISLLTWLNWMPNFSSPHSF
ncbi:unnamed protein product, partial [Ixodes pacificus]